jgi:hypothetical protein
MNPAGTAPDMVEFDLPKPIGKIKIPSKVYFFSGPLCIVETSIRTTMEGLYNVFSDIFLNPFRVILMLYVCVYAISFMFGLVNPKDFGLRLFKLAVVWVLVTNQDCVFYNNIYGGFLAASNDLVRIIAGVNAAPNSSASPRDQLYESLDNMFTNTVGVDGMVGLGIVLLQNLSSQGKGMFAGLLEFLGVGSMALAMLRAMVTLGIAMSAMAFFLLFTPMFLSFFLFQTTKRLFDNWLSMLISFTLQPFIIFAFLAMMKVVSNNAAALGFADVNSLMKDAMGMISVKPFQPEMLQGNMTINIYKSDREGMRTILAKQKPPIAVKDDATDEELQNQFLEFLLPKLLFWFAINMIMAGFIKEVPSIAQRLSGYISAPPLGASVDERGRGLGVLLPGISKGVGGETTSLLKDSLLKSPGMRQMAMGGVAIGTAAGLNEALRGKDRMRSGPDAGNQAAVGEANREGPQISRAGTLGELLGNKMTSREGANVENVAGVKDGASREGPNVANVGGVADGAVRVETTNNDNFRELQQRANEEAQKVANENIKRGEKALSGLIPGVELTAPKTAEKPTVRRDLNLRDVELLKTNANSTTYTINGKQIDVNKAEEEKFLMQKIAEINKDMSKTKVMGARGGTEMKFSMQQREILEQRLRLVLAEKRVVESAEQIQERTRIMGSRDVLAERIATEIPKFVQQGNVGGVTQTIAHLQAHAESKKYAGLIEDLKELEKVMGAKTTVREETVKNPQPTTATPAPPSPKSATPAQKPGSPAAPVTPVPQKPITPVAPRERKEVGALQKKALEIIAKIKLRTKKESVTKEMEDMETRLQMMVQNKDVVGIGVLINNLKRSPDAYEFDSAIQQLELLNQALEEERQEAVRQQVRTNVIRQQEEILARLDVTGLDPFSDPEEKFNSQAEEKKSLGGVGDAVAGAVGWVTGVDQQAVIETVQDAKQAVVDTVQDTGKAAVDLTANVVGSTMGVTGDALKQSIADQGRTMVTHGTDIAAAGAHLQGGLEMKAGEILASLAPAEAPPAGETMDQLIDRSMTKAGADITSLHQKGTDGNVGIKNLMANSLGGGQVLADGTRMVKQKKTVANEKFDPNQAVSAENSPTKEIEVEVAVADNPSDTPTA